ncbi:hypothetical protein FHX15_000516 [Rhizobium sp. BK650]|nr:hypothetical protein [Rhizobium sp. BK650]
MLHEDIPGKMLRFNELYCKGLDVNIGLNSTFRQSSASARALRSAT